MAHGNFAYEFVQLLARGDSRGPRVARRQDDSHLVVQEEDDSGVER